MRDGADRSQRSRLFRLETLYGERCHCPRAARTPLEALAERDGEASGIPTDALSTQADARPPNTSAAARWVWAAERH